MYTVQYKNALALQNGVITNLGPKKKLSNTENAEKRNSCRIAGRGNSLFPDPSKVQHRNSPKKCMKTTKLTLVSDEQNCCCMVGLGWKGVNATLEKTRPAIFGLHGGSGKLNYYNGIVRIRECRGADFEKAIESTFHAEKAPLGREKAILNEPNIIVGTSFHMRGERRKAAAFGFSDT